jgi:hypothetical protein
MGFSSQVEIYFPQAKSEGGISNEDETLNPKPKLAQRNTCGLMETV